MFPLVTGDPKNKQASFSRFVLPFAYQLSQCESYIGPNNVSRPNIWRPLVPINKTWRERYLTPETQKVLFKRASWFKTATEDRVFVLPDQRAVKVSLHPQLVLFEHCHDKADIQSQNSTKVSLNSTGDILQTGVLIIDMHFAERQTLALDDLLEINELFRYWRKPFEGHSKEKGKGPGRGYRRFMRHLFFNANKAQQASRVHLKNAIFRKHFRINKWISREYINDKIYLKHWKKYLELPVGLGKTPFQLLPNYSSQPSKWQIHPDDRTYVWTCALIKDGGDALRRAFGPQPSNLPVVPADYGHWIKLLNVDKPGDNPAGTHATRQFEREWADGLTFKRWADYGTFYGFTPHSGAMLADPLPEPPLWKHFDQMYFDQTVLLLYVRTTLFRFSRRLTEISAKARDTGKKLDQGEFNHDFEKLRWDFTLFTNLYQFPLLSNQQQAVEMYGLARKAMDIDKLFEEIHKEIHGSYDYLVMINEQRQAEMSALLTVVATLGLVIGLASGILGMSVLIDVDKRDHQQWVLSGGIVGICLVLMLVGIVLSKPTARFIRSLSNWLFR